MCLSFPLVHPRCLRVCTSAQGPVDEFIVVGGGVTPKLPVLKWAGGPEDLFVARLAKNQISVFAAPDMGLLDKKSIKLDGVQVCVEAWFGL